MSPPAQAQISGSGGVVRKLFFYSGPGDVLHGFETWGDGQGDPAEPSLPFSHEFFDLCTRLGAEGRVVSSNPRAGVLERGAIRAENRPCPADAASGSAYFLGWLRYMGALALEARRWGADAVFVQRPVMLSPFALNALGGAAVVPIVNVRLISEANRSSLKWRLRSLLDWPIYRGLATAVITASSAITRDITELAGRNHAPILEYLPVYRRDDFASIAAHAQPGRPFRILYAGRIERNKGVFDLLEVAQRLHASAPDLEFAVDYCGEGGALSELRERVSAHPLASRLAVHGHCAREEMVERLVASDVVVAPTQRSFAEGLNRVVVEAGLAQRPVVTSRVCPALDLMRPVAVEVPPEDIEAYAQAFRRLAEDPAFYADRVSGAKDVSDLFFEPANGLCETAHKILTAAQERRVPTEIRIRAPHS